MVWVKNKTTIEFSRKTIKILLNTLKISYGRNEIDETMFYLLDFERLEKNNINNGFSKKKLIEMDHKNTRTYTMNKQFYLLNFL